MQVEEKRIESIIRYWALLEELKRHKETIFGKSASSGLTFWRSPEEALQNLGKTIPLR